MRIKEISADEIEFDNGNKISCSYSQSCYEVNYADLEFLMKFMRRIGEDLLAQDKEKVE